VVDGVPAFAPELADQDAGFDPVDFARLVEVEPGSFWFRARNDLIVELRAKHLPDVLTLLEIGCGTGYVLQALHGSGLEVTGTELHPAGLAHARERLGSADLLQADGRRLPFDAHFDAVAAFDVLEHIEEDVTVLRELRRSVRPGGGLMITVPQHPRLWSVADAEARHVRRYSRAELRRKVVATGFAPMLITSFVSLLLPAMALSRMRLRRVPASSGWSELGLPGVLDRALERVLALERALIMRGVSLPVGGSLVLVARAV
jgi:SAM-dependent methyltransferase